MKMIKKIPALLFALSLISATGTFARQQTPITAKLSSGEREFAIKFLKKTEKELIESTRGLSSKQLEFKAAPDKWSVAECIKHIAAAEKHLWEMAETSLKQPENPEKRTGIKFTDTQLISAVEDRTNKSKTFKALEPAFSPYKTVDEALSAFRTDRGELIRFVGNTQINLRNHVSELPIGTYDAYQFILLISAHTNRHMQQIREVIANPDFPKS